MRQFTSKAKGFLLAAAAIAILLSCSDELKPIERETWEEYQRTLSSSGGAANISSSSEQKIVKEKISGVSQKGPFVKGSAITLAELDGNLTQTGNTFQSTVADDKGTFEISGITLASPYVRLKADGYYYNEVSGKKSISTITLYAIADLTDRSSLNVNLLTHLEHERVLKLAEGGKKVPEAKNQAQREILDVFGISGNFASSEDISVFGSDDNSAALLAISILMQGDNEEAAFTDLLADFSQSVKNFGTWSDAKKTLIADWASGADLGRIRSNVEGWGFSDVPDFERHVRKFWSGYYRLGDCNSAVEGSSKENSNPSSAKYGSGYTCNGSYWVPSSGASGKCSGQSYNPETHFCFYGTVFEKCEGQEYNPSNADCELGVLRKECGNGKYIVTTQFCFSDAKYDKCGGSEYTPDTEACCNASKYTLSSHFCSGNTVYGKCGGSDYTPSTEACCGNSKYTLSTHFCSGNTIYSKCDGEEYNPATYFCLNSAITSLCGGKTFTSSQFCSGSTIYSKCSGSEYNPAAYFCLNNAIAPLCGGQQFTSSQFCSGNAIHNKCGGSEYNPETQSCSGGVLYSKCDGTEGLETDCCGNAKYTVATHFCYNNSKVGQKCGTRTEIFDPDLYECVDNGKIYLRTPISYGGESYEAVLIGTQTWMAENLNYYGQNGLYDWSAAMNIDAIYNTSLWEGSDVEHQGICPPGWHIPSRAEWSALVTFAGGSSTAGAKLKATSGWASWNNGTDDYGFSALPEGDGSSYQGGGYWWSASNGYYLYVIAYGAIENSFECNSSINCRISLHGARCVQNEHEVQPLAGDKR
jgi:uncharacterized protein (TIGR02145 family)